MAFVRKGDFKEGMRGKFGNMVFRVVKGRTIVARKSTAEPTAKQKEQRARFRRATQYAKVKMTDPATRAYYESLVPANSRRSPFAEALRDCMTLPKILSITVTGFTGAVGSVLPINVSDNFKIITVRVIIMQVDSSVLESGEATYTAGDTEWRYTLKQAIASLPGIKITATAVDRPGNEAVLEQTLS